MTDEKTTKVIREIKREILDSVSCLRRYENMNGDDCVRVDAVIEIINSAISVQPERM